MRPATRIHSPGLLALLNRAAAAHPPRPALRAAVRSAGASPSSNQGGGSQQWSPQGPGAAQQQLTSVELNFDNGAAFASKETLELARQASIQALCKVRPLVQHADAVIRLGRSVLGDSLVDFGMRHTFFGHFCGGERLEDVQQTIRSLEAQGVGSILDYAAEKDVNHETLSAQHLDDNADATVSAIDAAASQAKGYAALKVSSILRPATLLRASARITAARGLYADLCLAAGQPPNTPLALPAFDAALRARALQAGGEAAVRQLGDVRQLFDRVRSAGRLQARSPAGHANPAPPPETVSLYSWCAFAGPLELAAASPLSALLGAQDSAGRPTPPPLSAEELGEWRDGEARVLRLGAAAGKYDNVNLMVDAEQTYLQPAIDWLALDAAAKFNGTRGVVMNTYQCYLRDALERVRVDLEGAVAGGFVFGAKIVRGAYMHQERRLAAEQGYPDPVQPSKAATHAAYDAVVDELLGGPHRAHVDVLFGSHNENSVRRAASLLQQTGVPPSTPRVAFAQLLGMCDHVTLTLAAKGYRAYKYVPYGPIQEVMPYLLRRAQENSDMLGSPGKEMRMAYAELAQRLNPFMPRSQTQTR